MKVEGLSKIRVTLDFLLLPCLWMWAFALLIDFLFLFSFLSPPQIPHPVATVLSLVVYRLLKNNRRFSMGGHSVLSVSRLAAIRHLIVSQLWGSLSFKAIIRQSTYCCHIGICHLLCSSWDWKALQSFFFYKCWQLIFVS